ncbi:hypothetical protein MKW94_011680, partial [Papaver nudicaule]|nr:hypothetical protein [Papaver nudicaule]
VREAIGVTLSVVCSNIRLSTFTHNHSDEGGSTVDYSFKRENWDQLLTQRASELAANIQNAGQAISLESVTRDNGLSDSESQDVKWMETIFHFIISSLKSGRSSLLLNVIVDLIHPVIALQETSNKDLSTLAKASFELLKWRILPEPHLQKAILVLLSLATDGNWRTRHATLTYLRSFMYRHFFVLSRDEKQAIWKSTEKLLTDSQVEVREHAAGVLAGLLKGGDEDLVSEFRNKAFTEAFSIQKKARKRVSSSHQSVASTHGAVLALAASVLSVPYDMPSWLPEHVTLLARFIGEPSPIKSTVMKAVAEFRRTHADTWSIQKDSFNEEQLEVLADTTSSSSYFA